MLKLFSLGFVVEFQMILRYRVLLESFCYPFGCICLLYATVCVKRYLKIGVPLYALWLCVLVSLAPLPVLFFCSKLEVSLMRVLFFYVWSS